MRRGGDGGGEQKRVGAAPTFVDSVNYFYSRYGAYRNAFAFLRYPAGIHMRVQDLEHARGDFFFFFFFPSAPYTHVARCR